MRITIGGRSDYPEPIQKAFAERLRGIEWLDVIEPAVLELQEMAAGSSNVSIYVRDHYVSVSMIVRELADALPIRRAMTAQGWRLSGDATDLPECEVRMYRYVKVFGETEVPVNLCLSFVGSVCRYIEVGMKSVPDYKLVCEEGE